MALTVGTRKNTLAGGTKSVRFHTRHQGTVEFSKLLDIMATARTTITKPDLAAAIILLAETIARQVGDGNFVKTPLDDFYLTAVGMAENETTPFTPCKATSGHGYRLRFRPDRSFERDICKTVAVRRDDQAGKRFPGLRSLVPVKGSSSCIKVAHGRGKPEPAIGLDRGGFACLHGSVLKFDSTDEEQGVFFFPKHAVAGNGSGLRCTVYASIRPSLVILQVPADLVPGEYQVELRTSTKAGNPRSGRLKDLVKVGEVNR